MITAVIIDDEKHVAQALNALLELYCPEVQVRGEAYTICAGIDLIRRVQPTTVFLDIQIGSDSGFDLLKQLPSADFHLIFTTAHSDYAMQAFRFHAVDYLLKPIDPVQLQEAIAKVKEKASSSIIPRQLDKLLQTVAGRPPEKLTVATSEGYHFIEPSTIILLTGDGCYTTFYLRAGERVVASKPLKHFEAMLPNDSFIKVHQSHLVNLQYVRKFLFEDGGLLLLEDGLQAPVARRRRELVLRALW